MDTLMFFVILMRVWYSLSCNCTNKILQEHICEDDFVLAAHVLDNEDAPDSDNGDRRYKIWITQKIKGLEDKGIMTEDFLYTRPSRHKCGLILPLKQIYVLSGKIIEGKMWIYQCGLAYIGSDLPCDVAVYQKGCGARCRICEKGRYCEQTFFSCTYRAENLNNIYSNACVPSGRGCGWRECDTMTALGSTTTKVATIGENLTFTNTDEGFLTKDNRILENTGFVDPYGTSANKSITIVDSDGNPI